ncbi:MAG: FkbM family methyltransferase [Gemmatimonadetes bacterium]|nr:FkbM family methyltransferase [Gemmatimonadota bacterium]
MNFETPWGQYAGSGWIRGWLSLTRRVPQGRVASRLGLLARRMARVGMSGPVDTTVWGFKLRLALKGGVSEGRILFFPQLWDVHERDALADVVRQGTTFVDVGANVGGYTFWAASRVGPEGTVVAVEATPALVEQLRFNVDQNDLASRIRIAPVAVSDETGECEFVLHVKNPGENRLASVEGESGNRVTVPMSTLAQVLTEAEVESVDVMKVDIEGAERRVLEAFFAQAPSGLWPRFLMVEAKGGSMDLILWLEDKGYALVRRTRLNGILRRARAS